MGRKLGCLLTLSVCIAVGMVRVALTQSRIADGQNVFQATCSSQYCHGLGGAGGQGPKLIDHPLPPEWVDATIRNGRSGGRMPAFNGILSPTEINAVAAYVLSLSPAAVPQSADFEPSTLPVSVGREQGTPSAGAQVFFDATRLSSCHTCHSFHGRGGPLGADLATLHATSQDVLARITRPTLESRNYPVISLTLVGGEKLAGVRAADTESSLQLFDVYIPPVRRTLQKSQIAQVATGKQDIFDHTTLKLAHQQLLDVAALLSSTAP